MEKTKNSIMIDPDTANEYFINIAHDLMKKLPQNNINPSVYLDKIDVADAAFSLSTVSYIEVRDIICSLKNKDGKDIYGFNVDLIKYIKDLIVIPLTKLINYAITEGLFPSCLKKALILPIHKKGNPDDIFNFRPISLLPIFSKIFEKVLKSRITAYFENNNLFVMSQYGFRSKKSTIDAILDFTDKVTDCFETGEYMVTTFCDLSKAFDCVQHDLLVRKLVEYKFDLNSINMIKSYLIGRTQKVKCGNDISQEMDINIGVPQGQSWVLYSS